MHKHKNSGFLWRKNTVLLTSVHNKMSTDGGGEPL